VHGNNAREALIKICLAASMAPGLPARRCKMISPVNLA